MNETVVERRIQAPADRVWQALTDLGGMPGLLSGVDRVEVLTEGPFAVGTRWRETRRMLGRKATEEMYVTACEEPSRYVAEADAQGIHYVTEFRLTPEKTAGETAEEAAGEPAGEAEKPKDTTLVRMVFSSRPPSGFTGLLAKAFGPIGARAVAKAVEKDLADVAAAVEPTAPPEAER
jgi:uncharacterized membrane protein